MKSSFKKKENVVTKDANYFYFGSHDLDGIFNNHFMRGSIMLIEEDYPTKHYLSLLRYFVGCGVHLNQKVFIYDLLPNRWKTLVPTMIVPKTGATDAKVEDEKTNTEKSKIAWRYDSMDIKLKDQNFNKDIPIMDLSKNIDIDAQEFKSKGLMNFVNPREVTSYKELLTNIYNKLQDALTDSNDKTIKRFVFPNFFTSFCQLNKENVQDIIKFFHTLRVFARTTYCEFVFTIKQEDEYLRNNLRFIFDYVLGLEVLKNNEEFEDFQGFLRLVKVPNINKFQSHPHDSEILGFKASKKTFEIDKLYLNPEKESTEFTGKRHEGPLLCSTTPGGNKDLEF